MVSEALNDVLEQNRKHLQDVLDALDAEHKMADDPEEGSKLAAALGSKRADMTDEERAAWLFEENAKALAAAAKAATGDSETPEIAESDKMSAVKDALGGW